MLVASPFFFLSKSLREVNKVGNSLSWPQGHLHSLVQAASHLGERRSRYGSKVWVEGGGEGEHENL